MRFLYLFPTSVVGMFIVLGFIGFAAMLVVGELYGSAASLQFKIIPWLAMVPTVIVIVIYLCLRANLGKRYIIAIPQDIWHSTHFLLRIKGGKVAEVSSDILWKSDIGSGDEAHELYLNYPDVRWVLPITCDSVTGTVYFTVSFYERPTATWQQLYEAIIKNAACDSWDKFVSKRLHDQTTLHLPEVTPIMAEYLSGKIKDSEMLRRLAENISGWRICPEFPGLKINITLSHDITIERANGAVNVTIDGAA